MVLEDSVAEDVARLPKGEFNASLVLGNVGCSTRNDVVFLLSAMVDRLEAGDVSGILRDEDGCFAGSWNLIERQTDYDAVGRIV